MTVSILFAGRSLFNPHVDYNNQWTPVGHSDPLKNGPTFDYVPPTLDSVRYWSERSDDKSDKENLTNKSAEKNEILLLGVPVEHSLHLQSNHLPQSEAVSGNRRSTPYYPPEVTVFGVCLYGNKIFDISSDFFQPSRVLMPPAVQSYVSTFDQSFLPSEYNYYESPIRWNTDQPASHSNDAFPEESASYVTVIRPKTNPSPYSSTIYNKNVRNSIYHLAANVNSLEPVDKKPHWIQSLLQKEITYQAEPTTPQVVLAYSPHLVESPSTNLDVKTESYPIVQNNALTESTTPTPLSLTTDSLFSHYNQPVLPVRGPMYLIIQGHSKVKTYGPDASVKPEKHEAKMVPVTAQDDPVVKHIVSLDPKGAELQVKHLHKLQASDAKIKTGTPKPTKKINSPMDSLLSLLDSSLGNFAFNSKETKYKVIESKRITATEKSTTKRATIFGPTTIRSLETDS